MKYLFALVFTLFSSLALAEVTPFTPEEAGLIFTAIQWVAGEYYVVVLLFLLAVGFVWAQVRQLIKPETMAKLPDWLIVFLESVAANNGHAKNELEKNPVNFKRMQ
ncbi:TPA: hypothetical protein I7122_18400 [Vibrio vulnificus]|nr:hypothetical protein [Vibrio vulnificus]